MGIRLYHSHLQLISKYSTNKGERSQELLLSSSLFGNQMGVSIMIVGYTIGAILIVFGLAVLYQIFTGSTTGLQRVSYPTIGIVLLIIGAGVCFGVYTPDKSKNRLLDTDSPSL